MHDRDLRTAIKTIADHMQTPSFSQIQKMSEQNRRLTPDPPNIPA